MIVNHKFWAIAVLLGAVLGVTGCSRGPRDVALVESGRQFLAKKDYARAALQFRGALQANPKNFEAYYQLGLAEIGRGDNISAYRALSKAVDLNPKHNAAQLKMAELLLTSSFAQDIKAAQEHAKAVLEGSPDNPDALDTLAVADLRLGNREQGLDLLREAGLKSPRHLQTAVLLALSELAQKNTTAAEHILKGAVEKMPDSLQARVLLGTFYLMVGNLQAGEQQLRTILQKDPNNVVGLFALASALQSVGRNSEAEEMYRRLANGVPSSYKSAYGTFLFRVGKQKDAVAEFERLAKLDAKDINARTRLVAAYVATKRLPEAQHLLDAALGKNPRDTAALLQRSELHLTAGTIDEARKDLLQILHFDPVSARAHFLLSGVEEVARALFKQRQELAETLRLDPRFFAARIALARSYITAGEGPSAVDLMNHTPLDQKSSLGYLEYNNWALLAAGDLRELQKGIAQGLAIARTRDLIMQDALMKLKQGNDAAARSGLLEILKSNPEDLGAVDVLVRSYSARQQFPAAIEKVQMLIRERPNSPALEYRLAALLVANRQPKEARAALAAALAANPLFPPVRLALASMDQADGKPDAARQVLGPLLTSKTGESRARNQLGFVEAKAGNYAQAIEHLRKVVEAEPQNIVALNNLAYLLADHTSESDEALKYAQRAKDLAPTDITVEGTLGWAYFQKGVYEVALQHLKEAVNREGTNVIDGTAIRRYHLAMAYARTRDVENATRTLSTALKLDPNLPEAQGATRMILTAK